MMKEEEEAGTEMEKWIFYEAMKKARGMMTSGENATFVNSILSRRKFVSGTAQSLLGFALSSTDEMNMNVSRSFHR